MRDADVEEVAGVGRDEDGGRGLVAEFAGLVVGGGSGAAVVVVLEGHLVGGGGRFGWAVRNKGGEWQMREMDV